MSYRTENSIFEDDAATLLVQSRGLDCESLPIGEVRSHPNHPRGDDEDLQGLADTIAAVGMLQPIHVVWLQLEDELPGYYCVAGERRLRAAKLAGLVRVPVRKLDEGIDAAGIRRLQLVENCQRKDLTPLELARCLKDLEDAGMGREDILAMIGKSKAWLSKYIVIATTDAKDPSFAGETAGCKDAEKVYQAAKATTPEERKEAVKPSRTSKEARQSPKGTKTRLKLAKPGRNDPGQPAPRFRQEVKVAGGFTVVISHPSKVHVPAEEIETALMAAAEAMAFNRGAAPESEAA